MKKFTTVLCTAALSFGMLQTAFAAPSIGQLIPEAPVVQEVKVTLSDGTVAQIPENLTVTVLDADPTRYDTSTTAGKALVDVLTKFNDDKNEEVLSIMDVLNALKGTTDKALDPEKDQIKIYNSDVVIDPSEYEPLMPFVDLVLTNEDNTEILYDLDGNVVSAKLTFTAEVVKGFFEDVDFDELEDTDKEELLKDFMIMQIDPSTNEVYFIEIEEYNPETGEITAEFPCLGSFTVVHRSDLEDLEDETEGQTQAAN
jgi:hypothetical protein